MYLDLTRAICQLRRNVLVALEESQNMAKKSVKKAAKPVKKTAVKKAAKPAPKSGAGSFVVVSVQVRRSSISNTELYECIYRLTQPLLTCC